MKILLSLILALLVSTSAYSQSTKVNDFDASMLLREGLRIDCDKNMKFADRVAGETYNVALKSEDLEQYSGFAAGHNAECNIKGHEGAEVVPLIDTDPSDWVMTDGTDSITIHHMVIKHGGAALTPGDSIIITNPVAGEDIEIMGTIDSMGPVGVGNYSSGNITIVVNLL